MRVNRPIGILLLLWPTLWSLWFAASGPPPISILVIFILGVFIMRSAGCVINDIADQKIDPLVKRTKDRPLATQKTSTSQALCLFVSLLLIALILVLCLNKPAFYIACLAVLLASVYPFVKRFSHFPQVVLGLAFSCSIPMAYAAILGEVPTLTILVFCANLLWTVAYDTYYAMVDQDDDVHIGVHSTSIFMGKHSKAFILICQGLMLVCLSIYGYLIHVHFTFYLGLILTLATFIYQHQVTRSGNRDAYFHAFLLNNYSGLMVFLSIFFSFFFQ